MWTELQPELEQEPGDKDLSAFWTHLRNELQFKTLLYYNTQKCHCWLEDLLQEDNLTATLYKWTTPKEIPYLKPQLSLDIFTLACMMANEFEQVLEALGRMLNHMREMPVLLQIGCSSQPEGETTAIANVILRRCYELLIPNVLLLASDFFGAGNVYAYQTYPMFQLNTFRYNTSMILYPHKLGNLHGHPIRVDPHFQEPFLIKSISGNGSTIITGIIYRLMEEFARYHNGTLVMSTNMTVSHFSVLQNLANNTVDISAFIVPTRIATQQTYPFFSYPITVASLCIMLPVEGSASEDVIGVFQSPWMWLYLSSIYGLVYWLNGLSW